MTGAARTLGAMRQAARDDVAWSGRVDEELIAEAQRDDLAPLVYHALRRSGAWDAQPDACRDALRRIACDAAAVDAVRLELDRQVVSGLDQAGVAPLIFKGAALAHRQYPESWLRPRVDTDLLVRRSQEADTARVLERIGFSRAARPTGDYVTHQFTYVTALAGVRAEFDVHWKVSDPHVFADLFTYDDLARDAVAVPPLGAPARAVGDVHALLIACVHRVAHHYDQEFPLFLYDIDLLARSLDEASWSRMTAIASAKRIRGVCARGLGLAADLFGTPIPASVSSGLAAVDGIEPSAGYLRGRLRRVDILASDMRALGGWRARARLLREHLLPAPPYVLASYGKPHPSVLPALYVHRIIRGAFKWFRPLNRKPDMTPGSAFRPAGRVRSSLYGALSRCGDLFFRAGNACGYVAAGLLRRDDLRAASRRQFEHYCASDDDVDAGLTPFELRLFAAWVRPRDRVLLIGSGAGRDLVGLRRLGYDVTGLEQVPELVDLSRRNLERHGLTAPVVPGLIETARLGDYDAIIWSDFSYGCVHPSHTRIATLARLRDALSPTGRMLVGYMTFVSQRRASAWLARWTARLAGADWQPEPGDAIGRDPVVPGVLRLQHHFRPGEIARECAAAGLRIVAEEIGAARTRYAIAEISSRPMP